MRPVLRYPRRPRRRPLPPTPLPAVGITDELTCYTANWPARDSMNSRQAKRMFAALKAASLTDGPMPVRSRRRRASNFRRFSLPSSPALHNSTAVPARDLPSATGIRSPSVRPPPRRRSCHEVRYRAPVSWSRPVSCSATARVAATRLGTARVAAPARVHRQPPEQTAADLGCCCRRGTQQDGLADARHAIEEQRASAPPSDLSDESGQQRLSLSRTPSTPFSRVLRCGSHGILPGKVR